MADEIEGEAGWLTNLSVRGWVGGGGEQALVAGVVLEGAGEKTLLWRAVGPGLVPFGVEEVLADPRMELQRLDTASGGTQLAENTRWSGDAVSAAAERVGAFPVATGSADAALLQAVTGGRYTVTVVGNGETATGAALVKIYDGDEVRADAAAGAIRLVTLSTRGEAGTASEALVAGFVVAGQGDARLLLRAVGPGLAQFGVKEAYGD